MYVYIVKGVRRSLQDLSAPPLVPRRHKWGRYEGGVSRCWGSGFIPLLYGDVGGAAIGFVGVEDDVDAGGEAAGEGAVEGGAGFVGVGDGCAVADDVAGVGDDSSVVVYEVTDLATEAHGVDGGSVGVEGGAVALLHFLFFAAHEG